MNLIMILSFLLLITFVGIITYYKTRGEDLETQDGYFLGGRSLSAGIIASSLLLTNLNVANFIGMSAQAFDKNMSVMGWEVSAGITLVIVALFFIPRYLKAGITTIPDFLEDRFDKQTKLLITYLFLFAYIVNVLPPTLYSGAIVLGNLFNLPEIFGLSQNMTIWIMVWFIGIIGSIYAIFGGLKAIAISGMINAIGLFIGGILVPLFALIALGQLSSSDKSNFSNGIQEILSHHTDKLNAITNQPDDPVPFLTLFTGMLLVNLYYWGTNQGIIQKALGAKNLKEGQKGIIFAGFLKIFTPFIILIPGIIAFHYYTKQGITFDNSDMIYPKLIFDTFPPLLTGFFAAVMFGSILGAFGSFLNGTLTLFTLNIYKPAYEKKVMKGLKKAKSEKDFIKESRIIGIAFALISMTIAPLIQFAPNGLFDYLQRINGLFNVPIFMVFLIGYLTKRVPAIAAKISLTIFVISYAFLQFVAGPYLGLQIHFLHQLFILFIICSTIMLIVGRLYPRDKDYQLINKNIVDTTPWKYRYIASIFVIILMISMYIIFSNIGIAS